MIPHDPNSPSIMSSPVPVRRGHGGVAAAAAERAAAGRHQHLLWESQSPVYQEAPTQRPVRPTRRRAEMTDGAETPGDASAQVTVHSGGEGLRSR